mgnify:FL=1
MSTLQTGFTQRLGIALPIVQAPIGGHTNPELAVAVSRAGGLGMLALSWTGIDEGRAQVAACRERLGSLPFGINLVLVWNQHARLDGLLEAGAPVVSFFWGDPSPYLPRVREAGALSMLTVATPDQARRAIELGVDVVVAQGVEAGGHVLGEMGLMALLPQIVDVAGTTPVLAAGGIADGRGLAAAMTLGAGGAWMGTRFVASAEADVLPAFQEKLIATSGEATFHGTLFDEGWPEAPHRVLRNSTVEAWQAAGRPPSGHRPGEGEVIAHTAGGDAVRRYSDSNPARGTAGDWEAMALYAGQSVGLVHDIAPAQTIVTRIAEEARQALAGHQR